MTKGLFRGTPIRKAKRDHAKSLKKNNISVKAYKSASKKNKSFDRNWL